MFDKTGMTLARYSSHSDREMLRNRLMCTRRKRRQSGVRKASEVSGGRTSYEVVGTYLDRFGQR